MNVTIRYTLNAQGQKSSILSGGNGKVDQVLTVGPEDSEFRRAVELSEINNEGNATVWCNQNSYSDCVPPEAPKWDHLPTPTELLDSLSARLAACRSKKADQTAEIRENTLTVLREKKTKIDYNYLRILVDETGGEARYDFPVADWPYPADKSVQSSPEAAVWLAELATAQEAAKAAAQTVAEEDARQKIESKKKSEEDRKEAQRKEQERRESLGLREGDFDYNIEQNCLADVPVWEDHSRGKNWLAVISLNPSKPGGLERSFAEKAKGGLYYHLPTLNPGDAVEFGADYYSGRGKKNSKRWYGYVVRVDTERLILHKVAGGKTAIKEGQKFAQELVKST